MNRIEPGPDKATALLWQKAVRDHPDRPQPAWCHVLWCLALRLGWKTGTGYASIEVLAADAGCSASTVKRATDWARKAGLLVQTSQGGRRGTEVRASEWMLCPPVPTALPRPVGRTSPTAPPGPVGTFPIGQEQLPNSSGEASQQLSPDPPSLPKNHLAKESSLSRTERGLYARLVAELGATEREANWIVQNAREDPSIRQPFAYLRKALDNGDGPELLSGIRAWIASMEPRWAIVRAARLQREARQREAEAEAAAAEPVVDLDGDELLWPDAELGDGDDAEPEPELPPWTGDELVDAAEADSSDEAVSDDCPF
jgi:hypothetical protein